MKGRDPWNRGYKEDRPEVLENVKQAALKRKPQSTESREKQAQKTRGQKRTEEQRKNISNSLKGKVRGPMSEQQREAISKGTEGKHYTQTKIQCPHCPVQASKARYNAFHGDRCKQKL